MFIESSVAEHTSQEVADAFNAAFEGYFVPLTLTPQAYERRMRGENLDPHASYGYSNGGDSVALILVARRGWTTRVAAMAVTPGFRGQGLGRRMLMKVVDEARARGDRSVILEVLEQNHVALGLYQKCGFNIKRRLVGFTCQKAASSVNYAGRLSEIDPYHVGQLIAQQEIRDWPWNLAPQTLSALTPPSRAIALDECAFAILSDTGTETVRINAVFVLAPERGRGRGSQLLHAITAAFPARSWLFSPVIPEGLVDHWFLKNGWLRHPLVQLEMECLVR